MLFLAEAFTQPKVMHTLAALGFSQSYTYFTWRTAAWELREYGLELAQGPGADYFRPNFWPNTPDILAGPLRDGPPVGVPHAGRPGRHAEPELGRVLRLRAGARTSRRATPTRSTPTARSTRSRSARLGRRRRAVDLAPYLTALNTARRAHPALRELRTLRFHGSTDDEHLLVYSKTAADGTDPVLVVVNLDPTAAHEGLLHLDLGALGLSRRALRGARRAHRRSPTRGPGPSPYVKLDPAAGTEAHVLAVSP